MPKVDPNQISFRGTPLVNCTREELYEAIELAFKSLDRI